MISNKLRERQLVTVRGIAEFTFQRETYTVLVNTYTWDRFYYYYVEVFSRSFLMNKAKHFQTIA